MKPALRQAQGSSVRRNEEGDGAAAEAAAAKADEDADEEGDEEGDKEGDQEGDEVQIEVGDANVWEELSLAVTSLKAGQEGRFTRRPAEGSEGRPRTFRVRVEKVQERDLPPLDDQLAKRLGDFETVDALRQAMEDKLRHDRGHERDAKRREALMEQMRQRYPVPLPEGVLHEESQTLLNDYAQDIARRGVDPQKSGIDWNKLGEQFRPHATRRVHDRLLLDAVADQRDLQASPAEVDAAVASIARSQGVGAEQVRKAMGGSFEGLGRQIRREKAIQWLLGEEGEAAHDHDHDHGFGHDAEHEAEHEAEHDPDHPDHPDHDDEHEHAEPGQAAGADEAVQEEGDR